MVHQRFEGAAVAHIAAARWMRRNLPMPAGGNQALVNAFPLTPLAVKVEIALAYDLTQPETSWAWADITNYVRHSSGIDIGSGRKDEHSLVEAGTMSLTLDNRDGRFSRRNPASPYYPYLTRNTPVRVSVNAGSGFTTRAKMFVNNWPGRADRSGQDVTVPLNCAGVLRRIGQGSVARSPLRHFHLAASPAPIAYWPMEDLLYATSASSGLVGGSPLAFVPGLGRVTPGDLGPWGASSAITAISHLDANTNADSGTLTGTFTYPGTGKVTIDFWFTAASNFSAPTGAVGAFFFVQVNFPQPYFINFNVNKDLTHDGFAAEVEDSSFNFGGSGSIPTATALLDGEPHHVHISMANSGANIVGSLVVDNVAHPINISGIGLLPTTTQLTKVYLPASSYWLDKTNGILQGIPLTFSHLAIYSTDAAPSAYQAGLGYPGEMAHVRLARLCAEEGIPFYCIGNRSPQMAAQSIDTFLNLVRECEASDLGVLYEKDFGLGYQTRSERHNAAVGWNLDFRNGTIADPPAPEDDDLYIRNKWTVNRRGGLTYIALNQPSIDAVGLYDDSADVNLYSDTQVPNAAYWRLHMGLTDNERWPGLTVNLASTVGRTIIDQYTALPFGTRLLVAHPPDAFSPYPADVFIEGVQEHLTFFDWFLTFNTSPAQPFEVYAIGSTVLNRGRVDSSTSTLTSDPGTTGSSLTVATTGVRWIDSATYPALFPFDINIGGEQMTVTAIAGTSSPQTFTVTRSVNGAVLSHPAGSAVHLWQPPVYAM
jgi:hypothetical protein